MIFSVEKIHKELSVLLEEAFKEGYLQGFKDGVKDKSFKPSKE